MENKKQRTLLVLIGVFLFIFAVSVAYAVAAGTLTLQGAVTYSDNLKVEFTAAQFSYSARVGETAPSILGGGQTVTFAIVLDNPGDSRTVQFKVTNTGNIDAVLDSINVVGMAGLDITVTPALVTGDIDIDTGVTLPSSGFYEINIKWDTNPIYADLIGTYGTSPAVIFATIDYDPAPVAP